MPIEVEGTLHLDAPSGRSLRLQATGGELSLHAATLGDLRDLVPGSLAGLPSHFRRTPVALAAAGLALDVSVDGRRLLTCGAHTRPNWLARLARLPMTRVRIRPLLAARWR